MSCFPSCMLRWSTEMLGASDGVSTSTQIPFTPTNTLHRSPAAGSSVPRAVPHTWRHTAPASRSPRPPGSTVSPPRSTKTSRSCANRSSATNVTTTRSRSRWTTRPTPKSRPRAAAPRRWDARSRARNGRWAIGCVARANVSGGGEMITGWWYDIEVR